MKLFLDTSAFAKRHLAENGSGRVLALCAQAHSLALSVMCLPELISTLARLLREKKLTKGDYAKLKQAAAADLADADICQLTPAVLSAAIGFLETGPLRAMDALHVACAQAVGADLFVSADHRQLDAARKAGLNIEDVS